MELIPLARREKAVVQGYTGQPRSSDLEHVKCSNVGLSSLIFLIVLKLIFQVNIQNNGFRLFLLATRVFSSMFVRTIS